MSKLDCGGSWIACPSYIGNSAGSAAVTPPNCVYVAEDGVTFYVAEDGVTFYIPSFCVALLTPNFNIAPSPSNITKFGRWRIM